MISKKEEKIDEEVGGREVPHFLIGHSLGGFLSASLSVEAPDRFAGMSLITPFLGVYDEAVFKKVIPIARMLNWVIPSHIVKMPTDMNKK